MFFLPQLFHISSLRAPSDAQVFTPKAPIVRQASAKELGLDGVSIPDSSGARWSISYAEAQQSNGWDIKFTFEDLFKKSPDGKLDFDANVKSVLKELATIHPFFRQGLQAAISGGYKFELYDPQNLTLSAEDRRLFEGTVGAMTFLGQGLVVLKLKTDKVPSGGATVDAFVSALGCELSHVINNRTYSSYDDPKDAFKNIKSIAEREKKGERALSNAEELLFRTAGQEILGHIVAEELLELKKDKGHKIDPALFSPEARDFIARSERWLALAFMKMWGKDALVAIQNEKSPYPEIISDEELKLFKTRLARNIVEGPIREQLTKDLKRFGFGFKE